MAMRLVDGMEKNSFWHKVRDEVHSVIGTTRWEITVRPLTAAISERMIPVDDAELDDADLDDGDLFEGTPSVARWAVKHDLGKRELEIAFPSAAGGEPEEVALTIMEMIDDLEE